jgi:hypothetical protein
MKNLQGALNDGTRGAKNPMKNIPGGPRDSNARRADIGAR